MEIFLLCKLGLFIVWRPHSPTPTDTNGGAPQLAFQFVHSWDGEEKGWGRLKRHEESNIKNWVRLFLIIALLLVHFTVLLLFCFALVVILGLVLCHINSIRVYVQSISYFIYLQPTSLAVVKFHFFSSPSFVLLLSYLLPPHTLSFQSYNFVFSLIVLGCFLLVF